MNNNRNTGLADACYRFGLIGALLLGLNSAGFFSWVSGGNFVLNDKWYFFMLGATCLLFVPKNYLNSKKNREIPGNIKNGVYEVSIIVYSVFLVLGIISMLCFLVLALERNNGSTVG